MYENPRQQCATGGTSNAKDRVRVQDASDVPER